MYFGLDPLKLIMKKKISYWNEIENKTEEKSLILSLIKSKIEAYLGGKYIDAAKGNEFRRVDCREFNNENKNICRKVRKKL